MYGNKDVTQSYKNGELIKELSIMNIISIVNTDEIWNNLPKELKDDIIYLISAYIKGSTLRALKDKDDRSNSNLGYIYEYLEYTQDEPFIKLRRKDDKY